MMPYADSVDKIVIVYLASVCSEPFRYKGVLYKPKPLTVSPLIFRGFTCPQRCGGCCPRFTLDYLPSEAAPYELEEREIDINGRVVSIRSDTQKLNRDHRCRNLDKQTGRCLIYGRHPFSCDFELIRFISHKDQAYITQKLFARGWAMKRVDGGRGALCEMLPADSSTVAEVIRKLERLKQWAVHFGIETHLDEIMAWVKDGPWDQPLHLE
jgi:Fe-S-cluster containining protein